MNESESIRLSDQGRRRRDAMLGELLEEVDRVRRRRRTGKGVAGSLLALALIITAMRLGMSREVSPSANMHRSDLLAEHSNGDASNMRRIDVARVRRRRPAAIRIERARHPARARFVATDPEITRRWRWSNPDRVRRLDDRALLETLASIGRPAGLILVGDRAYLSRPVANATSTFAASDGFDQGVP